MMEWFDTKLSPVERVVLRMAQLNTWVNTTANSLTRKACQRLVVKGLLVECVGMFKVTVKGLEVDLTEENHERDDPAPDGAHDQ